MSLLQQLYGELGIDSERLSVSIPKPKRKFHVHDRFVRDDGTYYRGEPSVRVVTDFEGRLKRKHRDTRPSNEWEAYYAVLWASTIRSIVKASRVSFSDICAALDQKSPFQRRDFW